MTPYLQYVTQSLAICRIELRCTANLAVSWIVALVLFEATFTSPIAVPCSGSQISMDPISIQLTFSVFVQCTVNSVVYDKSSILPKIVWAGAVPPKLICSDYCCTHSFFIYCIQLMLLGFMAHSLCGLGVDRPCFSLDCFGWGWMCAVYQLKCPVLSWMLMNARGSCISLSHLLCCSSDKKARTGCLTAYKKQPRSDGFDQEGGE